MEVLCLISAGQSPMYKKFGVFLFYFFDTVFPNSEEELMSKDAEFIIFTHFHQSILLHFIVNGTKMYCTSHGSKWTVHFSTSLKIVNSKGGPRRGKTDLWTYVTSEVLEQPVHLHHLISIHQMYEESIGPRLSRQG